MLCHLKKLRSHRSITVWENYSELLTIDHEHSCHYSGKDNQERRRSTSFSSITAATESLEFSDNGFKKDFELTFSRGGAADGGRVGGACPRTSCAHFALQCGRIITNMPPMGLKEGTLSSCSSKT